MAWRPTTELLVQQYGNVYCEVEVTAATVVNRQDRIPVLVSHVDGVAVESLAHHPQ